MQPYETKEVELTQQIESIQQKLNHLEAAPMRPQAEPPQETDYETDEDFTQFIRKGHTAYEERKALSSHPDVDGGLLVPDNVDYALRDILNIQSTLRGIASVRQISTNSLELLIDKDMADAGWVAETDARPETDTPQLDSIKIDVHEMYAKPRATQRLLDDANINVDEWITQKIAQKMAMMENHAFLHGNGDGLPKGILDYETAENNAPWGQLEELRSGQDGQFEDNLAVETLIHLFHSLKPQYLQGASWLMSRSALAVIRKLKDQATGAYIWQPALAEGSPSTLLGHPIHLSDHMPPLTTGETSKSIIFGNFREAYQIVDRQHTQILRDPYSAKPYVEFYATRRVGGAVVNFEALKVLNFRA